MASIHAAAWVLAWIVGQALLPRSAPAQDMQRRVDRAIAAGIHAIFQKVRETDLIVYHFRDRKGELRTIEGIVVQQRDGAVTIEDFKGKRVTISRLLITDWQRSGFVTPELPEAANGGPTALAALALLSAGVDPADPRMKRMTEAIAKADARDVGTYVHSLRASVWSFLLDRKTSPELRRKYRRLLQEDADWLVRAMAPGGGFDYGKGAAVADNSNSQFANLGLWAAASAQIEIQKRTWNKLTDYWLNSQHPGGGWPYRFREESTPSMTVAGCNSLYIILDRYFSKVDQPYQYFRGAAPNVRERKRMQRIYRAIDDGDHFLRLNPPDVQQNQGYELFGLERLGLASGRSRIGGRDWFLQHVDELTFRSWGENVIADAFALVFLAHGRAPILFQKLEHGGDANEWNYYHRDLPALTRKLNSTFERLHRWQRIPENADIQTLLQAPILVISGHESLELPANTRSVLVEYLDRGGTVFLHADRRGKRFAVSARLLFEEMFADRHRRFAELDASHPLFHCHYGAEKTPWEKPIPISALADGPRLMVILCPVDIAGAWHQERTDLHELFEIMANVRVYCAPPYAELPGILPRETHTPPAVPKHGVLHVARYKHRGAWKAHLGLWKRQQRAIAQRTGIKVIANESGSPLNPVGGSPPDLLYLTVRDSARLRTSDIDEIVAYLNTGGFLLMESADGQLAGNAAAKDTFDALSIGTSAALSAEDSLASGKFPGGQSLMDLKTTPAGASLNRPGAPPPILIRTLDGRMIVAACPFDLAAGLEGHYIHRRVGYDTDSTRRILDNILLRRWSEKSQHTANPPTEAP